MTLQIRANLRQKQEVFTMTINRYHDITNPGKPQTDVQIAAAIKKQSYHDITNPGKPQTQVRHDNGKKKRVP